MTIYPRQKILSTPTLQPPKESHTIIHFVYHIKRVGHTWLEDVGFCAASPTFSRTHSGSGKEKYI